MTEVKIEIHLKSQKKPLILMVEHVDEAKKLFALFENENKYVRFGNFIFDKQDFQCAIYHVITKKKRKFF